MIPEEKSAAVTRGLQEAFGVTTVDDIRMITRGRSPGVLVFRIVVRGTPYLLRIIMRTDEAGRHYACMRAAAKAGLAPRVWYTSVEDRISITDFVETVPFPIADARARMAATLRTLHALPPFAGVPNAINTSCMYLINKGPVLDGFLEKFRAANLLPKGDCEEFFARYEQLAAVYARLDTDMVSSHNDLFKPDNILFDGERVWLVDWEAAFLNDRYADLAVVANMIVTNDAEESAYLQEYFGQPPDEYQRARFFLMQQVAHLFYTMAFLFAGSLGKPENPSGSTPGYEDFNRRFWEGEVDLVGADMKIAYARDHWEKLLENVRLPRFNDALRTVAERHAVQPDVRTLRDFAERYTTAWCSQDAERVAGFFSPHGSLTVNDGEPAVGRDAITGVAQSFITAFPDLCVAMDALTVEGDFAEYFWTLTGTHTGPGGGGHKVRISGSEKWRLAGDGLIASSDGRFDAEEYRRQLEQGI